ncbi:MAG: DUF3035 domain-containing protein [Rhodobacteraceae bacterium]|nr:DUF3035 domain-containing protein [Paracoccaceae bacterium]
MSYRMTCCALAAVVALGACSSGTPDLLTSGKAGSGPDEFGVLPNRPLVQPESYAGLPEPTPGGSNLTDQNPRAQAIIALGGNPQAGVNDPSLTAYVTRLGVDPSIRPTLARDDLAWRKRNGGRLLEKAFDVNVYFKAYRKMELDQHRELERFRRAGVATPAAPPEQFN